MQRSFFVGHIMLTVLSSVNSMDDRETPGYNASDHIAAMLDSLRHNDKPKRSGTLYSMPLWEPRALITHVVYLDGAKVMMDDGVEVSWIIEPADDRQWESESCGSRGVRAELRKERHRCSLRKRSSGQWLGSWTIWSSALRRCDPRVMSFSETV